MNVPEHLWRFTTSEANESLASRLGLPYAPIMQDWECEVSDPTRIAEFIEYYKSNKLTDDEAFSLMGVIVHSFVELQKDLTDDESWKETLNILSGNLDLHIFTVWYWADFGETDVFYGFVSRDMKAIREASREKYA